MANYYTPLKHRSNLKERFRDRLADKENWSPVQHFEKNFNTLPDTPFHRTEATPTSWVNRYYEEQTPCKRASREDMARHASEREALESPVVKDLKTLQILSEMLLKICAVIMMALSGDWVEGVCLQVCRTTEEEKRIQKWKNSLGKKSIKKSASVGLLQVYFFDSNGRIEYVKVTNERVRQLLVDVPVDCNENSSKRKQIPNPTKWLRVCNQSGNRSKADAFERLSTAIRQEDPDVLRALLAAGMSPHFRDEKSLRSLLHVAVESCGFLQRASKGLQRCITYLLEAGTNVDACDGEGITSIHLACAYNQTEIASLLLDAGACATKKDYIGLNARY
eukprot:g5104.t1